MLDCISIFSVRTLYCSMVPKIIKKLITFFGGEYKAGAYDYQEKEPNTGYIT